MHQYHSAIIPPKGGKGTIEFNRVVGEEFGRYEGSSLKLSSNEIILINGLSSGGEEVEDGKYNDDDVEDCQIVSVYRMQS